MATVVLNDFSGGIAQDVRNHTTNECDTCYNFDIFTKPYTLKHIRDTINETGSEINTNQITEVGMTSISSTDEMVAFGYDTGATTLPASWIRTAYDFNGSWSSQQAVGVASYSYQKGTYVQYKGISYVVGKSGTSYNLQKYTTAGTMTQVGAVTVTGTFVVPRPFVHPQDNILYMIVGNVICTYDGTTFSSVTTILPSGFYTTSMCDYGGYLAIAMVPSLSGNCRVLLWGRDVTLNTLQGSLDFGNRYLGVIENLNNTIIGVSTGNSLATSLNLDKLIEIRSYSGGTVELLKTITIQSSTTNYNIVKAKKNEQLFFAVGGEPALYCFGKNQAGSFILTQERLVYNGGTGNDAVVNVYAISFVGDYCYISMRTVDGTYKLMATLAEGTITYSNPAVYKTSVNQGMTLNDRGVMKQLDSVEIVGTSLSNSATVTVKYSIDGSTLTTLQAKAISASGSFILEATNESTGTPTLSGRDIVLQVESLSADISEIRYRYSLQNQLVDSQP